MNKEQQEIINKKKADENKNKDGYEEIADPEFFRFEKYGDAISGKLIDVEKSERYGFGIYTIRQDNGETKRFHGSTQLDNLMSQVETGNEIQILYQDEQTTEKGEMKIFKVRRKKI